MNTRPFALVVVPPLSPSDTNPPLGPFILRAACERAGVECSVADLNAPYINRFKSSPSASTPPLLGDQDKDRAATHAARAHFLETSSLRSHSPLHLPDCADAVLGMHYDWSSIREAVLDAARTGSFWGEFFRTHLFRPHSAEPPQVLGISIMGPPQVFLAMVIAHFARQFWPRTRVVAGGSHVTLLANDIAGDPRYREFIPEIMHGHCEHQFADLVRTHIGLVQHALEGHPADRSSTAWASSNEPIRLPVLGQRRIEVPTFDILPAMYKEDLALYDASRVTLPLQLTRGCTYGKCTYCTYPAVEHDTTARPDWPKAIGAIRELVDRTGVRLISFKDSLFTPKNLRELADRLADAGLNIQWSATTLLHERLTPGLLSQLYVAGCRTLEVGLETIDEKGQALFDKPMKLDMIARVLEGARQAGIAVVLNQIFGWPGQTRDSAEQQVAWYRELEARSEGLVSASCNLLEVNRASPMSINPNRYGIELAGIAPWAFSYQWNAPAWRGEFRDAHAALFHIARPRGQHHRPDCQDARHQQVDVRSLAQPARRD